MSKYYKYFQPNELDIKDKQPDCSIRCLCKAENIEWLEAFDRLTLIARELWSVLNSKQTYETYLKKNGYVYHKISNAKGSKRPTVETFTKEHKTGTHVLVIANHYVCSKDGYYYDTWDCGQSCLYGYWSKEKDLV